MHSELTLMGPSVSAKAFSKFFLVFSSWWVKLIFCSSSFCNSDLQWTYIINFQLKFYFILFVCNLISKTLSDPSISISLSCHCLVLPLTDEPDSLAPHPFRFIPACIRRVVVVKVGCAPVSRGEPGVVRHPCIEGGSGSECRVWWISSIAKSRVKSMAAKKVYLYHLMNLQNPLPINCIAGHRLRKGSWHTPFQFGSSPIPGFRVGPLLKSYLLSI